MSSLHSLAFVPQENRSCSIKKPVASSSACSGCGIFLPFYRRTLLSTRTIVVLLSVISACWSRKFQFVCRCPFAHRCFTFYFYHSGRCHLCMRIGASNILACQQPCSGAMQHRLQTNKFPRRRNYGRESSFPSKTISFLVDGCGEKRRYSVHGYN